MDSNHYDWIMSPAAFQLADPAQLSLDKKLVNFYIVYEHKRLPLQVFYQ